MHFIKILSFAAILALSFDGCTDVKPIEDEPSHPLVVPYDSFVDVASITLDRSELTLEEGESFTLKATVSPDNATDLPVQWTSPDVRVAYVSGGVVTAASAGSTTIVARAGTKTAQCKVTVRNRSLPNKLIPFADPFILYDNGWYYLYGTGSDDGIPVVMSQDLVHWSVPGGGESHLALAKDDSYGTYWFWAPEVYKLGKKYIMYYTAETHICVAVADSPTGPFVQAVKTPMLNEYALDHSLFIDSDGKLWIFFVRAERGGIWVAELEDDCMTIKPNTFRFCITRSQDWEFEDVNEGPFVVKHNGIYYMTYSGNGYESPKYGIGYATATSPAGPWTKYAGNPIYQNVGGLDGVGHHAFFKDVDGRDRIVFHSHYAPGQIHPRVIHISSYDFTPEGVMQISEDFLTPGME